MLPHKISAALNASSLFYNNVIVNVVIVLPIIKNRQKTDFKDVKSVRFPILYRQKSYKYKYFFIEITGIISPSKAYFRQSESCKNWSH